jgi:hypothetical protein
MSGPDTTRAAMVVAAVAAVIGSGCGGPGDEDSSTQAGTESETGSETEGTDSSDTGNEVDCISAASGIGIELYPSERECTVLVRIAHEGHAVLGWEYVCGDYAPIDEAGARAVAATLASVSPGAVALVSDVDLAPEDLWVFWDDPHEGPGGVAAVSVRSGLGVFAATMAASPGSGEIVYPAVWRDGAELEEDCPRWGIVEFSGWDLVDGAAIEAGDLEQVLDVVERTALVSGMQSNGGQLRDVVVLRYPETVAPFAADSAEWVLALNGGRGSILGDPCSTELIGDPLAGTLVYADNCASNGCHGPDGNSGDAVALATVVPDLSDADILASVLCQHGSSLSLSEQQAADVLAYLREQF